MVNLVNTSGPHGNSDVHVFDEIPPVGPLEIKIATATKPKSVICQPGNREMAYTYTDGKICVALERLYIHDIIIVVE